MRNGNASKNTPSAVAIVLLTWPICDSPIGSSDKSLQCLWNVTPDARLLAARL